MKYLHFMTDQFYSGEFLEEIQSNFNIEEHQFILIKWKHKKAYVHPEKYRNINIFTISNEKKVLEFAISRIKFFIKDYLSIRKLMKQAENIFIHNLTEEMSGILFGFRGKAKILWVIWGADLYDYIPINLYDHYTLKLVDKIYNKTLSMFIRFYYSFFYAIKKKVIKKLDYIISAHQGDIKLLKRYYKTKAECLYQNIYPNPVDFEKIEKNYHFENKHLNFTKSDDKLLLLGNSGTPTNNHLDLMIRLSKMKEQNFKIICPLSYGSPSYIKMIVEKGNKIFGDRFIPLLDFFKPEQYYQILKQIDLVIMYHNRQQGIGNIQILVFLEKAICMKKTSIFFHLLERGVVVFSIQDLEKLILKEIEFSEDKMRNNKKIALRDFAVESARSSIECILNLLEKRNSKKKYI